MNGRRNIRGHHFSKRRNVRGDHPRRRKGRTWARTKREKIVNAIVARVAKVLKDHGI